MGSAAAAPRSTPVGNTRDSPSGTLFLRSAELEQRAVRAGRLRCRCRRPAAAKEPGRLAAPLVCTVPRHGLADQRHLSFISVSVTVSVVATQGSSIWLLSPRGPRTRFPRRSGVNAGAVAEPERPEQPCAGAGAARPLLRPGSHLPTHHVVIPEPPACDFYKRRPTRPWLV